MLARNSATLSSSQYAGREKGDSDVLLCCDNLPLYGFFVIRTSTRGAKAVHVVLDIVEAELAYLG